VRKPQVLEMNWRQRTWLLETWVTGMFATMIVHKLMRAGYRAIKERESAPVFDPYSDRFSREEAVLLAAAAGIGLGIAKVVGTRIATFGWEVVTGAPPPRAVQERTRD
jgi:hypothetical protein